MVQADVWLAEPDAGADRRASASSPTEAADAIFNATTLPGASAADITQAKNLYAMLTGRITSLTGDARINAGGDAYNLLGASRAEGRMREFNFFAVRLVARAPVAHGQRRPALRAAESVLPDQRQLHDPDGRSRSTASQASATSVKPGTLTGTRPRVRRFPAGKYAYNADRNNLAPSIGAAWQVPPSNGFMKWLRGSEEGDVVVRGGWAMAFQRPGLSDFTGVFGDNQGIAVSLQRDQNNAHAADPAAQHSRRCRARRR